MSCCGRQRLGATTQPTTKACVDPFLARRAGLLSVCEGGREGGVNHHSKAHTASHTYPHQGRCLSTQCVSNLGVKSGSQEWPRGKKQGRGMQKKEEALGGKRTRLQSGLGININEGKQRGGPRGRQMGLEMHMRTLANHDYGCAKAW